MLSFQQAEHVEFVIAGFLEVLTGQGLGGHIQRLHKMGGDDDDQLGLSLLIIRGSEQGAEDRNIAENREATIGFLE